MIYIAKMVAQRLVLGLIALLAVSIIIFFSVELLPGDIATELLGQNSTPEAVEALRTRMNLNTPPHVRYVEWLAGVFRGDFGRSLANDQNIGTLIDRRFSNTLLLAGLAAIIAIPLAISLGVYAALHRNGVYDRIANVFTLSCISVPEFFLAYILILVFAVWAGWFPAIANIGIDDGLLDRAYRISLAALTLTLVCLAHIMRMTRALIINVLSSPFIEMAHLKGLTQLRIVVHHALPNAIGPIINVVVINLAYLIVGVVVVEVVFVYPGLGQLMVESVKKRDIPVVQACSLIFGGTYILLNLLADILSTITNPKIMYPR